MFSKSMVLLSFMNTGIAVAFKGNQDEDISIEGLKTIKWMVMNIKMTYIFADNSVKVNSWVAGDKNSVDSS